MKIIDLTPDHPALIEQVAIILRDAFAHIPDTWSTLPEARAEVFDSFSPDRISRVALDDAGSALGWIGGIPEYDGNVYELHPLVVKPTAQGQGIGTALVYDFENIVRNRGAITIRLGTDDEFNGTNLYGHDLYPNVAQHILNIKNINRHPYEFYQKLGYVIVGLMPDANGFGKPDIIMSKRVGSAPL